MSDRQFLMQKAQAIFPEGVRAALDEFLRSPGWETGWKSNSKRDTYAFLHKHFAGHLNADTTDSYECESELLAPILREAWKALKDRHLKDHTLVRCYANGMMYGMDGYVHTDATKPDNFTFVYYPHARWSPNWGGETLFYNQEETAIIACSYPHPNSAALFDGRIPHRANSVTRLYTGLRITLMFKTELRRAQ